MSWFTRYASRAAQKAHARVTVENARYVREAIEKDSEVERLTQERDQARELAVHRLQENAQVRSRYEGLIDALKEAHLLRVDGLEGDIGDLRKQLEDSRAEVLELSAELLETSGRLATAEERLALVDREEDMRDEIAAKRRSDA